MKWPRAMLWKWSMNNTFTSEPPAAPRMGTALAATCSETTTPNRDAMAEINLATAGAVFSRIPFSAK